MIRTGDSEVHFTKVKPMQLAEIRSVLQKRPKEKFSMGMSPEAQEAMQEVVEANKIEQMTKKGKRCSKGNVLFKETVEIRQEVLPQPNNSRRGSVTDLFEDSQLDTIYTNHIGALMEVNDDIADGPASPRRSHGRRRSSVSRWLTERRGSLGGTPRTLDEVDEVGSANRVTEVTHEEIAGEERRDSTTLPS